MDSTLQQNILNWLNGDDAAYRTIFDDFYPKMFNLCLKTTKKREDSEEMVMNIFLNIWKNRNSLAHVQNFERYLFQSLRNQIGDFNRRNVLKTHDIEQLAVDRLGTVDHPELIFKELEQVYHESLRKLSDKQREVFLLSREQGLSQKEIAKMQDISPNTVNNHISSAMKIIRDDLGEYYEALPLLLILCSSSLR